MQRLFWIMGMWLVGIAPAMALQLDAPENLKFKVYWGFVRMGDARLSYTPTAAGYTLRAEVKDNSSLIDLHDVWESRGSHSKAKVFDPSVYAVNQAENSYRADKTMTFGKDGKIVYKNHLDASDKAEPLLAEGARDALATVYAWRLGGIEEVKKAAKVTVINMKNAAVLQRDAGVRTTLKLGNKEYSAWRVTMRTVKNGKPAKESWSVYLSDDANLKPLQIVTATKFGTFRASIDE